MTPPQFRGDLHAEALIFLFGSWFEGCCLSILLLLVLARMCRHYRKEFPAPGSLASRLFGTRSISLKSVNAPDIAADLNKDETLVAAEKSMRKLVYILFDKANRGLPDVFDHYDRIAAQQGMNFRDHIQDDGHLQALFVSLLTHAINSNRNNIMQRIFGDMQAMGVPRSLVFYASVMKAYARRAQHQDVLKMYKRMVQDDVQPDGPMYICLMNAAITCDVRCQARFFFAELCKLCTPEMRTYMTILRVCAKDNDWEEACKILDGMKALGAVPDNLAFNTVLGICIRASKVMVAQELVDTWKHVGGLMDVVSYNTLLKGYAQVPDYDKAASVLEHMQSEGTVPNLISYNTVMECAVKTMSMYMRRGATEKPADRACGRYAPSTARAESPTIKESTPFQEMAQKPWELLTCMEKAGLSPDKYTCSTLCKGMHLFGCSVREIDRAIGLLKIVGADTACSEDSDNARLLEVLFNCVLDACVNARNLNRMAEVFTLMRQYRVPVSAVTFGTLIKAFGHEGHLGRCQEVWHEMRLAKVSLTPVTYGCYIDVCIRNGEVDRADEIFHEMAADGCQPNTVIFNSLIRGFARAKRPQRALQLYDDMRQRGVACTSVTFNTVLDVLARHGSATAELERVFSDMRMFRMEPDAVSHSILMKASCSAGNIAIALGIFKHLQRMRLMLDEVALNSLLNLCAKKGSVEDTENVFSCISQPSSATLSIVVKMYGKAKMLEKAFALLRNQKPDLRLYTCLIQACVQNMKIQRAFDLFSSMQDEGIEPDSVAYGSLIYGCIYANKLDAAMKLVKQAYQEKVAGSQPVGLQSEVLSSLHTALRRKSKQEQAKKLEAIALQHGISVGL